MNLHEQVRNLSHKDAIKFLKDFGLPMEAILVVTIMTHGKVKMVETKDVSEYLGEGLTLRREYGETPNGNKIGGNWVLRDQDGVWIDYSQYRNDLAEHFNLKLVDTI